jgi:hypothetical protein
VDPRTARRRQEDRPGREWRARSRRGRAAAVADLFDAIVTGPRNTGTLAEVTAALGVEASDAILVDVAPAGIQVGHASQFDLLIGVARYLGIPRTCARPAPTWSSRTCRSCSAPPKASTAERLDDC